MKTLIQSLFFFFSCLSFSQVPELISYRAIATNSSGNVIVLSPIGIKISILDNTTPIFAEAHAKTTDSNGAYNLNIGGGAFLSGITFNNINWGSGGNKFLKVEIDPNGGTNYSINVGTTQLLSVPYAFMAKEVVNINGAMVNTIGDLRNYTAYVNNKVVYVKGYYKPGDGGEGFFIYNENENKPDNEGIIIKPNANTGNGRWIRQYSGYINVNYFGVVRDYLPNGFSNSDRIQKIIDFASSNGIYNILSDMTIFFPNGQYFIDKPLILKDKINLLGASGTLLSVNPGSTYDYMMKIGSGPITSLEMKNFTLNLRDVVGISGMHIKGIGEPTIGGIWRSTFKNISIINLKGNGIYLEGGTASNEFFIPNQYVIFENVSVSRKDANYYSLKVTGQQNNISFINCSFDAVVESNAEGTNILISTVNPLTDTAGSAVISFLNCSTGGHTKYGVKIDNSQNITFDNCWFEDLDISLHINNSLGINILNSRFANAAGHGSDTHPSYVPAGTGRCISADNSSVNIENNFVVVTNPNLPSAQNENFISANNNCTISAKNNMFQDIRLSNTTGIMQTVSIVSNTLNLWSKKLLFVTVPLGSTNNQINRINSEISAGETLFIRANQGSITFNPMDLAGTTGKNIFLNGRASLTLTNGQGATFIKIDNVVGNEKATYQLVSVAD